MSPSFSHLKNFSTKLDAKFEELNAKMHKTRTVDEQREVNTELKIIEQKGNEIIQSTKTISIETETPEVAQPTCPTIVKQIRKAAKREARKTKWATRRDIRLVRCFLAMYLVYCPGHQFFQPAVCCVGIRSYE